jgi:nicotinamide-nucleotide amidase
MGSPPDHVRVRSVHVEIINIGDELLRGEVPDRNVQAIARAMTSLGLVPLRAAAVGDDPAALEDHLRETVRRSDVLVTSGGLGQCLDDHALAAVLAATGMDRRAVQTLQPFAGTTAGARLEIGSSQVFMLPGAPVEVEAMLELHVLPAISRARGMATVTARLRTSGLSDSEVSRAIAELADPAAGVGIGIRQEDSTEVEVVVRAVADTKEDAAHHARAAAAKICTRLGHDVHGPTGETLAEAVATALRARGWTLAAVELGTGGLLGHRLTDVAAGAACVVAVLATESARVCEAFLGGSHAREDVTSTEDTLSLADAVRSATGADVGLALRAVAGPDGGCPAAPVGLVHCAVAGPVGQRSEHRRFEGMERAEIRKRAAGMAMRQALDYCREANR